MSGNLKPVREMSGNLSTWNCQGINLVMEKGTKNWLLLVTYLHSYRYLRCDFDRPNTFAVRFSLVQVGSVWSHARSKSGSVHFGSTWRLFT